ncbi:Ras family protein [Histomonas meleagridis]|uniref:Ras family protein n=1 Tax=Histomonas meleagridis TaxID=135588 RepID=UPI00355A3575|nr:Ras family protein [Histomonas meleagridis]KAH0796700.1 Ras family protein [Histomonas meleagridis]
MASIIPRKQKIVLLGDAGVGKTSLLKYWIDKQFSLEQAPTIGASFVESDYIFQEKKYHIQIWDTAGEEKYRSMTPIYTQGSSGALIVFNLADRSTFENVPAWLEMLDSPTSMKITLVGNKSDLQDHKVTFEEALDYCQSNSITYVEASAMNGNGVDCAFQSVIVNDDLYQSETFNEPATVDIEIKDEPPKKPCC